MTLVPGKVEHYWELYNEMQTLRISSQEIAAFVIRKMTHEISDSVKAEPHNFFDTEHLKSDLKGRSVRGGAVMMTSQAIRFGLQTGATVVLARLLTPRDYGLVAMVTAITGFVELIKDLGLSAATIQKDEITHSQVNALFWINVAVSLLLAVLTVVCAPIISWIFGEPRLTLITFAYAGIFIISGFAVQHQALLNRQMSFTVLAAADILSLAIGIISGIALALYGKGYWALVASSAAAALAYMVLVWVFCRWRPGLPRRGVGVLSMITFGGHLTVFNTVNYFARNLDNILIGRYWGATSLALYSKAYGLLMLPLSQINAPIARVAIPVLSRLQNDPERYRRFYLSAIKLIAYLTMPLVASLGVLSGEIIILLLGKQWVGASSIFMVLAFAGFFQSIANTTGWVYTSLNRTKRMAVWGLLSSSLTCVSFIIGLPWGPMGVAISYTIYGYLLFYFLYAFCFKSSPLSVRDVFVVIFRPAILSLAIVAAMLITRLYLHGESAILIVFGCFVAGGIMSVLILLISRSVRHDLSDIIETIKTSFKKPDA